MRRLFVPGYYSGFSNQRMSLDIAVGLAHLTGRVLVPYRFREPRRDQITSNPLRVPAPLRLPDLFDIPVAWSDEYLLKTWISPPGSLHCPWTPVHQSVFCLSEVPPSDDVRFQQFRNGREHVLTFSRRQHEAPDLHISAHTLGNYSHFFYLDEDRRRDLIDLMRRIQPKQPYLEAGEEIAASLGSFNAIHVRRGDFVHNELSKERITRAASIGGREIVQNLASRMRRDDPLVVCTDGAPEEELFDPIREYFRDTIFLHLHLNEHQPIRRRLAELPRSDETVVALLSQLVASKAEVFAGTLFSTFTGLIHRLRGWSRGESRALYCYDDFLSPQVRFERCEFLPAADGHYTWNRIRYPVSPDAYSWLREWPEAAGLAAPPVNDRVARLPPTRPPGEVAVTYDPRTTDGVGSQLLRIYGLYALSRALHTKYIHTPIAEVGYQGFLPLLTGRTDPDFVARYNAFFSLPSDDFDLGSCERVPIHILRRETVERYREQAASSRRPVLLQAIHHYGYTDEHPAAFHALRAVSPYRTHRPAGPIRVCIHLRRGDNSVPGRTNVEQRLLPNSYYVRACGAVLEALQRHGAPFVVRLHTEVPPRNYTLYPDNPALYFDLDQPASIDPSQYGLEEFQALPNLEMVLNVEARQALDDFATADVLVLSRSSLGYLGGLLNPHGLVVYAPWWHPALPDWLVADERGNLDAAELATRVDDRLPRRS